MDFRLGYIILKVFAKTPGIILFIVHPERKTVLKALKEKSLCLSGTLSFLNENSSQQ